MILISYALEAIPWQRPAQSGDRRFTPAKTRHFQEQIRLYTSKYLASFDTPFDPLAGPIRVSISFFLSKPKSVKREIPSVKPDIDNLVKSVLDAVSKTKNSPALLFENDSQIVSLKAEKHYAPADPKIVLYLEPYEYKHRYIKPHGKI